MNKFINDYFNEENIFFISAKEHPNDYKLSVYRNLKSFNYHYKDLKQRNISKQSIYFSLNTFQFIDNKISRKREHLKSIKSLFFDFDKDGKETGNKVVKLLGRPTYIIQTSPDKYQFIYKFVNEITNKELFEYVYEISKTLTKYLQEVIFEGDKERIDNTFDMSRVGRLPLFQNAKNNFEVKWWKTNNQYTLNHFINFIEENDIEWRTRTDKPPKTNKSLPKTNKKTKSIEIYEDNELFDYINYEKYLKAYNYLKKNNKDLSRVDFTFIKRFKKELEEDFENILSVLRYCRKDLMTKHGHEIERYINKKIEDS